MFTAVVDSFARFLRLFRRTSPFPVEILVPGLLIIWIGVLYPPLHHSILGHALTMTTGGALVALAHLANLRLSREHADGSTCNATCAH